MNVTAIKYKMMRHDIESVLGGRAFAQLNQIVNECRTVARFELNADEAEVVCARRGLQGCLPTARRRDLRLFPAYAGVTRSPSPGREPAGAEERTVMYFSPFFTGSVIGPLKTAPASKIIVSPGCAFLRAAFKSLPALRTMSVGETDCIARLGRCCCRRVKKPDRVSATAREPMTARVASVRADTFISGLASI